jgi:NitT/TauT family transport system substrate-binding protein
MTAGDAGAAFVAGRVDAAVTWEPWLSKAVKEGKGKILIDSRETPGLIVDTVALKKDFAGAHPEAVQAMVDALAEAMEYWKEHPDESNRIMAAGLKAKPEEFESDLKSIRLYDLAQNKILFGSPEEPGPLYETQKQCIEFYYQNNVIKEKPDHREMIDPECVRKASV